MFEPGNQLAKKVKVVHNTIKRALAQDDGRLLREAIDKQFIAAANGDLPALAWIADRLDGKPAQSVDVTSGGEKITKITIVDKTADGSND